MPRRGPWWAGISTIVEIASQKDTDSGLVEGRSGSQTGQSQKGRSAADDDGQNLLLVEPVPPRQQLGHGLDRAGLPR